MYSNGTYLIHYGVPKQRWGVRRYQELDGSYKPGAEGRYDPLYYKRNHFGGHSPSIHIKRRKAQDDVKSSSQKINQNESKAKSLAKKVAVGAAVGVTAGAAAYVGYKYYQKHKLKAVSDLSSKMMEKGKKWTLLKDDVVLKKGNSFQRIATSGNMGYHNGVYLSYTKGDKDLYRGRLGMMRVKGELHNGNKNISLKQLDFKSKKDMNVAGRTASMAAFKNLIDNDPKGVLELINKHGSQHNFKDVKSLKYANYKELSKLYDRFGDAVSLGMGPDNEYADVIRKYYKSLQNLGYDAFQDVNDKYLSTFKADNPIIAFDIIDSLSDAKISELNAGQILSAYDRSAVKSYVRKVIGGKTIGFGNTSGMSEVALEKYSHQLEKDSVSLSSKYTLNELANDTAKLRLGSNQIKKVSELMDRGRSHDEAVIEVMDLSNDVKRTILDYLNKKYKLSL